MNRLRQLNWQARALALMTVVLLFGVIRFFSSDAEIALAMGEPWEDMRKRSSASIEPAIPGEIWGRITKSDARLRFIDPQYGFVTPTARFFMISFEYERVSNLNLSPQTEPLLLDDTIKIVLDLQDQWLKGGWEPFYADANPPYEDTPEWRKRLREKPISSRAYWQAGDKYQITLDVSRFHDYQNPDQERFLITLSLSKPWLRP